MGWVRGVALLVFLESPSFGEVIRGCVTDAGGRPASEAAIHIDGEDFIETHADSQGCFEYHPGAGAYTIWAETKAGSSASRDVKVRANRSVVKVDLQIKPAPAPAQPRLMNLETLHTQAPEKTPLAVPSFPPSTASNPITFEPPVVSDQGSVKVTVKLAGARPSGQLTLWTSHPWVAAVPAQSPAPRSGTVTFDVPVKRVRGPSDIRVFVRASDGSLTYSGALMVRSFTRLTVTPAGDGAGVVLSSPSGVSCGIDCSAPFADDTYVKLTATPAPGSVFAGWSGNCNAQGVVRVTGSMTCVATFTAP